MGHECQSELSVGNEDKQSQRTRTRTEPEHKPQRLLINPVTNFTNLMSHVTTRPLVLGGRGAERVGHKLLAQATPTN